MEISQEERNRILAEVFEITLAKGLKATTMDLVASRLGMSKRTLYEIFESKTEMLRQVIDYNFEQHRKECAQMFLSGKNIMEGFIKAFLLHRAVLARTSLDFFKDMDNSYVKTRHDYERASDTHHKLLMQMMERGVGQKIFRKDVDFRIYIRLMEVQLESLKRMEKLFPKDITLTQATDAIIIGFLRSIATPEGLRMLEKALERFMPETVTVRNDTNVL